MYVIRRLALAAMRQLALDLFQPCLDVLAPQSEFVEKIPEEKHECLIISLDLFNFLVRLDSWRRFGVGYWQESAHFPNIAHFKYSVDFFDDTILPFPSTIYRFFIGLAVYYHHSHKTVKR